MRTNELRIGNYINYKGDNQLRVYAIMESNIMALSNNGIPVGVDIEDAEPIPLAEELLLKCRLLSPQYSDKFLADYSSWCISERDGKFYFSVNECEFVFGEVTHLHQLQNLYFALAGEELDIAL